MGAIDRLDWIDWMKAIGIYLVVLGHFYSVGEQFIYVFHIPLFFLISGFLSKREEINHVFWKKLWYNLIVPMLIMAIINVFIHCLVQFLTSSFLFSDIFWFVRNVVFGMVSGFDTLWFVYTLIILKVICQYCISVRLFYGLTIVMLVLAYIYNNNDYSGFPFFMNEPNAIVNVSIAYPFFAFGVYLRSLREALDALDKWRSLSGHVLVFLICLLVVAVCCRFNGYVAMYRCYYGENMFLFLTGGIAGSIMVFSFAKLLGKVQKAVLVVSRGTIIVLGFHKHFIILVRYFFPFASYMDIVFATLIVVLFVPLIIITEKHFTLMAGKYRIS